MKMITSGLSIRNIRPPKKGQKDWPVKNVPALYLTVGKRTKTWRLRARPPGEKNAIPIKMGPYGEGEQALTFKAAKAKALEWKEIIAGGGDPRIEARKVKDNTFASVREAYLRRAQTVRGRDWKPSTKAAYKSALEHPRLKKWGSMPVASITYANVQEHINKLEEEGKYTAARRYMAYLRAFFSWCRKKKQGHIRPGSPLPTDSIELEKPQDNARTRHLSPEEIKAFWQATERMDYPWGAYYRVLLLSGQRLSEVASLRRSDVKKALWTQVENKADRSHLMPLNALAISDLEAIPNHSEYYFTTRGDVPISGFSKSKKKLDEKIAEILEGEEMEPWTSHDLRRTMTTRLREMRIPLMVCSRLLNHAERGVTAEHYDMYDMLDEKTQAMDAWGDYLERLIHGKPENVVELKQG